MLNGPSPMPNQSITKQTWKSDHSQNDNRFNVILPKVVFASLFTYSGLHSIILSTPSTPSTRGLGDGQDPVEPLARDGATSSSTTSSSRGDNTGRGFQHRHRPYPLEVNHCCSCRLHALVARAVVREWGPYTYTLIFITTIFYATRTWQNVSLTIEQAPNPRFCCFEASRWLIPLLIVYSWRRASRESELLHILACG